MALPEHILTTADSMGLFFASGNVIDQYAESRTGVAFDPEAWETGLAPLDFHLAVLARFLGTWENSGCFVNESRSWWDERVRVIKALVTFGCEKTASMFDEAAELGMHIANRYDSDQDITPDQASRRGRINHAANEDISYEKLATFIREHHQEFLT